MNINIKELEVMRDKLEIQYNRLEKEISKLYVDNDQDEALEKEQIQDIVDQQIDLIDLIIKNLENTPKMYEELMKINEKYKTQVGE